MEIVVADDQLSLAIGKRGQNVRLAAKLTGWKIDMKSESRVAEAELLQFASFDGTQEEEAEDALPQEELTQEELPQEELPQEESSVAAEAAKE